MLIFSIASASGCGYRGRKVRTKKLKFSYSRRCASDASVSNTSEDLPDPDTPVKMVILRFGSWSDTSFKLFSRAPRTTICSCTILSPSLKPTRSARYYLGKLVPHKNRITKTRKYENT